MLLRIRVKRRSLIIVMFSILTFVLCFDIYVIQQKIPYWNIIIEIGRCLFIVFLFVWKIVPVLNKKRNDNLYGKVTTRAFLYATLIVICIVFSTVVNKGNVVASIFYLSKLYLICIFLEAIAVNKERLLAILDTWKWLMLILVVLDLLTILLYPKGMYVSRLYTFNWLLGYKTERLIYSLPMISIFAYTSLKRRDKVGAGTLWITLIALIDAILAKASAASITIAFILICFIILSVSGRRFSEHPILYKILDYRYIIAVYAACIIALVFFQNVDFIEKYLMMLDKSENLSGRFTIWSECIHQVCQSPLIGKGYMTSLQYAELVGMPVATNAHNMVLTILMSGGGPALLIYILMCKSSLERRDRFYLKSEIALTVCIYGMLLLGTTSSTFVFSSFGVLFFWLMEFEKRS